MAKAWKQIIEEKGDDIAQWFLVFACAATIFILSSQTSDDLSFVKNEQLCVFAHFCEYWVLAILLVGALDNPEKRKPYMVALLAILIASLYGATDELHQLFVPGRCCDIMDWLTDTLGAVVGAMAGTWFLTVWRLYRKKNEAQ